MLESLVRRKLPSCANILRFILWVLKCLRPAASASKRWTREIWHFYHSLTARLRGRVISNALVLCNWVQHFELYWILYPHTAKRRDVLDSLIISREGLILTLSILPCPQGRIFWSTPCRKIDDNRMSAPKRGRKSIPLTLEISRASGMDFPITPEFWWSTENPSLWTGKDWQC